MIAVIRKQTAEIKEIGVITNFSFLLGEMIFKNVFPKKNAANTAGYILTPMGGALTIIGVPLYLYGKKMMQVNINYTGNGAGVSATF